MTSITYGKSIMSSVIMAKILWQMKLSPFYYILDFPHRQMINAAILGKEINS